MGVLICMIEDEAAEGRPAGMTLVACAVFALVARLRDPWLAVWLAAELDGVAHRSRNALIRRRNSSLT